MIPAYKTIKSSLLFTIVALIVISTSLSACGLKRDLYLPDEGANKNTYK